MAVELNLKHVLTGPRGWIGRPAWSPDGALIAAGSSDKQVYVWNTSTVTPPVVLRGHDSSVFEVAFSPAGTLLATASRDATVRIWDLRSQYQVCALTGHQDAVRCVAWSPDGELLATGSRDGTLRIWNAESGIAVQVIDHLVSVRGLGWSPGGDRLAAAGAPKSVRVYDRADWTQVWMRREHRSYAFDVAWSPAGDVLASCSGDRTIVIWDATSGDQRVILEGHTNRIGCLDFSCDGRWLASKASDATVRVWDTATWQCAHRIQESGITRVFPGCAFHPTEPVLASLGEEDTAVRLWTLEKTEGPIASRFARGSVRQKTAKVVMLGDSGVGKTSLGWLLAKGEFKDHPSTHGQQFWVLPGLGIRSDDTESEVVLWDFAGQPDYRLVHALFLDDVDLALILFDPTDPRDPLHGVEYWLRSLLQETRRQVRCILVGAREDRGATTLTAEEVLGFCEEHGITGGYVSTSARERLGIDTLEERIRQELAWDDIVPVLTTQTFQRIKRYVMSLKESKDRDGFLISPEGLRDRLQETDPVWTFTEDEMMTTLQHLAKHGFVQILQSVQGETILLLVPELLNNLASSFVLEARRNPKGLGALEESRLLRGEYAFKELAGLPEAERDLLLDSVIALFLRGTVCLREVHGSETLLIFPELINLKAPRVRDEEDFVDDFSYSVVGKVENVYSSLVVLMGYTNVFTRTHQWQNHARYLVDQGEICGFRQVTERDGRVDFFLYFNRAVSPESRHLFRSLFERFLSRQDVKVSKFPAISCTSGHTQERATVARRISEGRDHMYCDECGDRIPLLEHVELPGSAPQVADPRVLEDQQELADRRSRLERVLARARSLNQDRPSCFISYAWGVSEHEDWVRTRLAPDLRKAGIDVILDVRINRIGDSLNRFLDLASKAEWIVVVGTLLYNEKYENQSAPGGSKLAAEFDIISHRLMGTEEEKRTVLPLILEGTERESLPASLRNRICGSFQDPSCYFESLLDLIVPMLRVPSDSQLVEDMRGALVGEDGDGDSP